MIQETQHTQDIENPGNIILNDNTALGWEVWAEVLDVAKQVDEIERIWWLKEFLGLYNTKIWALRIASLDKARAANDNNKTESKKAA